MTLREPHESTWDDRVSPRTPGAGAQKMTPALALVWSLEEPERVGEVACLPPGVDGPFTLGRAVEPGEDGAMPLVLTRLRPFERTVTGALRDGRVSRWQLRIAPLADGALLVEQLGRGGLQVNGHDVESAVVVPGDVVTAVDRFSLLYTHRPSDWPREPAGVDPFPFGEADAFGIVGESAAAWELRHALAFVAPQAEHVLVHGPSGAGKELIVRAIHQRSGRRTLVARNATTIPESLLDAELYGNIKDYPNPGTPDRVGMLGEAHEGTLFLDELGELPHAHQAHLLRVMDCGQYTRLGETGSRTANVRFIGATNRDPDELKHDLRARFIHTIGVPGLDERPEDIPLIVRHLLRDAPGEGLAARRPGGDATPLPDAGLIGALAHHPYKGHVRELKALLLRSIAVSVGSRLTAPPELEARGAAPRVPEPSTEPGDLTREQIVAALEQSGGVREKAWRLLGLRSRDQLKRLMKKLDIG
ncbi:sigma 54-interacting transcriptional regulator [Nannocystis sp. ILAH1]|uniref:sigma 54-dependent Fis family transcriptional regulator n=1 Tax=Nannocystis sp. ILAH1 TaxID=2996789 RepID=UPI00226FA542|nr:sigma 54-interacting transcriptional regulator [Nannocystis sp. ILAH1]MCY0986484.1 sigma 54-interacting transcriptional regulator [Nannocystis sp. ILAH1]